MFGLKPLFIEISNRYHDWLLKTVVSPTAPMVPNLILRKRRFSTGQWY
jgi:hypothetical protein